MGNSGSEQAPVSKDKDNIPVSSLEPAASNGKKVEQTVTNGSHPERKLEVIETVAQAPVIVPPDEIKTAPAVAAAGLTLTRPNRAPPQPLEGSSEESSTEEDDEKGKWITRAVELGPDGLPSKGSAGHGDGDCKRCCFFPKGRCSNAYECEFCHYDHEKRKRLKKKKKRSENPTPNLTPSDSYLATMPILLTSPTDAHGYAAFHPPTPLSVTTPLGSLNPGSLLSPISPAAPPMLPPSLNGIEQDVPPPPPSVEAAVIRAEQDVPPPPSVEAAVIRACAGELASGLLPPSPNRMPPGPPLEPPKTPAPVIDDKEPPSNPAPQEVPISPSDKPSSPSGVTGSAAKLTGTPVTLTDLFSSSGQTSSPLTPANSISLTASTAGTGTSTLLPTSSDLPLWPPQVTSIPVLPSSHVNYWPTSSWNEYSANHAPDWNSYGHGYGANVDCMGLLTATLPPPLPGVAPSSYGGYSSSVPQVPSGGLQHDSPRSAVLTLCGAWGALKASRTDQLTKSELLAYRGVVPKGSRPKQLRSLRTQYIYF